MSELAHLARRFVGSLSKRPPTVDDARWAESFLLPIEAAMWRKMSNVDRRHHVLVARRFLAERPDATRAEMAGALLHDVGKVDAGLGAYGRTVATLSGAAVKRDPETIRDWTRTRGFTRRVGLYLQHPRLGGDMLELAGSDPLTVAWAREHHLPADEWTVPADLGAALKDADDD